MAAAAVGHRRGNVQRRMELAGKKTKNNQPEVAAAVVAWRQLLRDIVASACSAEWNWLKKKSTGGDSGGKDGSGGGSMAAAAVRHRRGSVQRRMEMADKKQSTRGGSGGGGKGDSGGGGVAPRDIVAAACSAEWNWLGKTTKTNQPEVAATVVAKVAAAVVAWR